MGGSSQPLGNHPLLLLLTVPWNCPGTSGMSFSLQIEDQNFVEFDLSSWTHLILIGLCYALGLCHFCKSCALPPSILFPALFLSPVRAHNVASTILRRDSENIWPLGEKYYIISNPSRYSGLHLPCFLQYVQQQHLSVNPLGQLRGTQCLLEVHILVASLQGQFSFQG